MILTFRYRVKDRHSKRLNEMARAVNFVWNFCGDTQDQARKWSKKWPSAFDLINLTAGSTKMLCLPTDTILDVCKYFARSRQTHNRRPRWRGKRSLGWIPFQSGRGVKLDGNSVTYGGRRFYFWDSRPLSGSIKCGSFSQDATGRWYINLYCEVDQIEAPAFGAVGIDLGLKTLATCSDGRKIENLRHGRTYAEKLARAQCAGRKRRARAIHRKIANVRRHNHHVETTRLANTFRRIVVGNVSSAKLGRTRMAKSVYDAGWYAFKEMLRYKIAMRHGAEFEERDERYSTQTCSDCGSISGPTGRKGLVVREWRCGECGSVHDRDCNAAINILGPERRPPRAGIAA